MNNKSVDAVLSRLAGLLNTENDSDLARMLGINRQTLASWRKRDSVPYSFCINFAEERGLSIDWLLTGRGQTIVEPSSTTPSTESNYSQSDLALLEMINQLDPEARRDLLRSAEEKRQFIEMKKKVEALSIELERNKNAG
ncbi:helix-turn-helix domain containing protein [Serratia sp. PL7]|uniref:helix-turn-helix domain containing protein n=1 Tax=Serratia sp. PL7 TaxID=2952201 RepID=UPI0021AD9372|nr:helix-turn-helix domain containing protein [Serratia sp. PL7]